MSGLLVTLSLFGAKSFAMKDLTNPRWIKFKGVLFLFAGLVSSVLLVLEHLTFKVILLLVLSVWCFCRAYYFAFYVIEHYVDPGFRFSGLGSFIRYCLSRKRSTGPFT
jgi:hypothetical protein